MPFEYDAAECLADVLENVARIEGYVAGLTSAMLAADTRTHDAVERCLERICEAVFRLDVRATELIPGQPTAAIRGMGNRLRHAYDRLDFTLVWKTIVTDLPLLKAEAARALAKLKAASERP